MELTEERLAEIEAALEKHKGICAIRAATRRVHAISVELLAEIRRLREVENEREEARGLAREYLYALWEEDSEEVRKAAREKEAQFYPWLLEPEPATATGVAETVFGMIAEVDSERDTPSGWVYPDSGIKEKHDA